MSFCLRPDQEPEATVQPPIWSMVIYMLLTETFKIDDGALGQRFGLPVPSEDPPLLELGSRNGHSGKLTGIPSSKQNPPFIHLDRQLGVGWSSVYSSSKSCVVVKFAVVPKKDKAELGRQLSNEKAAYHTSKLRHIAQWVIPRLYGEYEWFGGRALILADEGQSLSHLEEFVSLPLIERLILFGELYCIHLFGVEHRDVAPRNVLRKRWSWFLKMIDFGFSNVNHTCPGWRKCGELNAAREKLGLDRMNFRLKSWVREKFRIRPVAAKHEHE
ncbi:hypothetical protein BC826DRAFT_1188019 [Russula brevipes]|nr:hypothetical protein BC826DRAFT_1188019 [Russula brevipes]